MQSTEFTDIHWSSYLYIVCLNLRAQSPVEFFQVRYSYKSEYLHASCLCRDLEKLLCISLNYILLKCNELSSIFICWAYRLFQDFDFDISYSKTSKSINSPRFIGKFVVHSKSFDGLLLSFGSCMLTAASHPGQVESSY